jgi:hypothetical protein
MPGQTADRPVPMHAAPPPLQSQSTEKTNACSSPRRTRDTTIRRRPDRESTDWNRFHATPASTWMISAESDRKWIDQKKDNRISFASVRSDPTGPNDQETVRTCVSTMPTTAPPPSATRRMMCRPPSHHLRFHRNRAFSRQRHTDARIDAVPHLPAPGKSPRGILQRPAPIHRPHDAGSDRGRSRSLRRTLAWHRPSIAPSCKRVLSTDT